MERIIIRTKREAGLFGLFDPELLYGASSIYTYDESTYWNKSLDKAIESYLKGVYDVDYIISQTPHTKKARVFKPGVKYNINFKVNKIIQYYGVYSGGLEDTLITVKSFEINSFDEACFSQSSHRYIAVEVEPSIEVKSFPFARTKKGWESLVYAHFGWREDLAEEYLKENPW